MKVWTKIKLTEKSKNINLIAAALTNYIYSNGPINDIVKKYNITVFDKQILENYTTSRISGLLLLYMAKDKRRINDIINKYNRGEYSNIISEIEGYIEKKSY